jgi:hypothetical protein
MRNSFWMPAFAGMTVLVICIVVQQPHQRGVGGCYNVDNGYPYHKKSNSKSKITNIK